MSTGQSSYRVLRRDPDQWPRSPASRSRQSSRPQHSLRLGPLAAGASWHRLMGTGGMSKPK
eukprot:3939348-Rhodomonas_salina.1